MQKFQIFILILFSLPLIGQKSDIDQSALAHVYKKYSAEGYNFSDVEDIHVLESHRVQDRPFTNMTIIQKVDGVPVHEAFYTLTVKDDGTIIYEHDDFITDIKSKVIKGQTNISAGDAIMRLGSDLGYKTISEPLATKAKASDYDIFTAEDYSNDKVGVKQVYFKDANGQYRLSYEIFLSEKESSDSWFAHVDATSGEIIGKRQNTIYCQAEPGMYANHSHSADCNHREHIHASAEAAAMDGAQYFVLPLPIESPIHGDFALVQDPSYQEASPYGWHDVDGVEGADYTITRGNNVWAYQDQDADDTSNNDEPDGGADLIFNYEYNEALDPADNMEADVTGLFYVNNMIHDLTYLIGFTPETGNYQVNSYGMNGRSDVVRAEALDGSGTNNANFGPSPDGFDGRMQMFRWEYSAGIFRVKSPNSIAAEFETNEANWAMTPDYSTVDVSAGIVVAQDRDPSNPELACGEIVNDVEGQIAMIFRGGCFFGLKALNAQEAGAVAVIICNVPGADGAGSDGERLMGMSAGDPNDPPLPGDMVTIPVTAMAYSDCVRIVSEIDGGINEEPVIGEFKNLETGGPTERSSGFDNGVIAHEMGHGISNRLVGPASSTCLSNGEQAGEGISDYLGLIMTVEPGDQGTDARGIGNFSSGLQSAGRGIRRFPYSTDMDICPLTYNDIRGQGVHAMGEIWCAVSWDIYWAFVDLYGWDADWRNKDSGNFKAVKLFFDALDASPCSPGFIDLRDAVFALDGGEHECMLWEIFARRGLGYFADQGSADDNTDNSEDFTPLPTCRKELKIRKEIDALVFPGDEVSVNIELANHTDSVALDTKITDLLDEGMSLVSGSITPLYTVVKGDTISDTGAPVDVTINGNEVVFNMGDMARNTDPDEILRFSFRIATDPTVSSQSIFKNTSDTADDRLSWLQDVNSQGTNFWNLNAFDFFSEEFSWYTSEIDFESDQRIMFNDIDITGENPVLRIYHRINCTPINNGGWVEFSEDGVAWQRFFPEDFVAGGYTDVLTYDNKAIPNHWAFSDNSETGEWEPMYIKMGDFAGQEIDIRFRFGTYDIDENQPMSFGAESGWFVDDVELMDLKKYVTEATISADNADSVTSGVKETVIDTRGTVSTKDEILTGVQMELFPNPAQDVVTLKTISDKNMEATIDLFSSNGRHVSSRRHNITESESLLQMDVSDLNAGLYFLQINSNGKILSKKLIIE